METMGDAGMTKLYIADTFIFAALAIIWKNGGWIDMTIKWVLVCMTILHIWGGMK